MPKYTKDYLKKAHKASIFHEAKILVSNLCGCFHCLKIFDKSKIWHWEDESLKKGRTAMCPFCGVDAILDGSWPIKEKDFMVAMNDFWFDDIE